MEEKKIVDEKCTCEPEKVELSLKEQIRWLKNDLKWANDRGRTLEDLLEKSRIQIRMLLDLLTQVNNEREDLESNNKYLQKEVDKYFRPLDEIVKKCKNVVNTCKRDGGTDTEIYAFADSILDIYYDHF